MSDWLAVLRGQTSIQDFPSLLAQSAAKLEALLASEPYTEQRVLGILQHHIGGPLRGDSWDSMLSGLKYYLGDDLAYMLAWLVQDAETTERLERLRECASPAVMSFLGAVLGVYGADLGRAYDAWNQLPGNWSSVSREVFYDQLSQVHRIVFRISKFSGDEASVEGPPDSFVTLTTALLRTLRLVGQPDVFQDGPVEGMLAEAAEFVTFLGRRDRMAELLDTQAEQSAAKAEKAV